MRVDLRDETRNRRVWSTSTKPARYKEAVEAFRARVPMTKATFDALDAEAKQRAFTVAGVAQLDVVAEVWRALDRAIAEGTSLEDFRAVMRDRLARAWRGSVDAPAHRLETIFRTNVQSAYSAGRWAQLTDPDVLESHTHWRFDAVLDDRTSDVCEECDGTVLPASSAWWAMHNPPLHFNCRSGIVALTTEDAKQVGITHNAPTIDADTGFGHEPGDVGAPWKPKKSDYPVELWNAKEIP